MKTIRRISMLLSVILLTGAALSTPASAGVSFELFYSNLSHDGHWLVSASYGRVWQPTLYRSGWNPYYDGHWVYADVGWTWVSDYTWGAIPYHYGTWVFDPAFGWVWVPGYVWAPSWVVFTTGPDYIGWAPVPPRFAIGVSIGRDFCTADSYVFVSSRDFLAPRVRGYAVPVSYNRNLVGRTHIVNNIRIENHVVVNHGPSKREVERWSGRKIDTRPLERVPGVAADKRFSRAALRVDSDRASRGVRAAEPTSIPRQQTERVRSSVETRRAESTREAARQPRPVTPSRAESRSRQSGSDARASSQAKANGNTKANANTNGRAKANGKAKAKANGKAKSRGR